MMPDPEQERQDWKDAPWHIEAGEVMTAVWSGFFSNADLRAMRRSINHYIERLKEKGKWPH